jgi:hypothetical protein
MKADARPPVHQTKVSTGRKRTEVFNITRSTRRPIQASGHGVISQQVANLGLPRPTSNDGSTSRATSAARRRISGKLSDISSLSLVWAEAQYKRSVSRVYHNGVTGRCSGPLRRVLLCSSVACVRLWPAFVCGLRSSVLSAAVRRVNRAYTHASSRCCRNRCSIGLRARASAARKCCLASACRLHRCSSSPSAAW